ncbi:MAG: hypothetical protein IT556_00110 [Acetobacteraceae bacterium]|nr:hypothetical protein [Acetobacteraceae bacterium]
MNHDDGTLAFLLLAGAALLASLLLALLFILVARRAFGAAKPRALAYSFAAQAALVVLLFLSMAARYEGIALLVGLLAPVALVHAAIAPFFRKA